MYSIASQSPFSGQTFREKNMSYSIARGALMSQSPFSGQTFREFVNTQAAAHALRSQSPFSGQTFRGHHWNPPSIQGKNCHFNETQFFSQKILPKSYKNHPKPPSVRLVGDLPFPNVSNPWLLQNFQRFSNFFQTIFWTSIRFSFSNDADYI